MTLQTLIVAGIVSACAAYLGLLVWRLLRGKATGCGCSDCPSQKRPNSLPKPP